MDEKLQDLADKIIEYAEHSGVQYCDARAEQQVKKSILIENKEIEHTRNSEDKGIGVRLIKNGAWSFCSISNPKSFDEIKSILDDSIKNSDYTNSNKKNKIIKGIALITFNYINQYFLIKTLLIYHLLNIL